MCAIPVLNYCNTKLVLIVCLISNSFFLLFFTFTETYELYLLSRFMVGFFQVRSLYNRP
jgi:hypothetical protein